MQLKKDFEVKNVLNGYLKKILCWVERNLRIKEIIGKWKEIRGNFFLSFASCSLRTLTLGGRRSWILMTW